MIYFFLIIILPVIFAIAAVWMAFMLSISIYRLLVRRQNNYARFIQFFCGLVIFILIFSALIAMYVNALDATIFDKFR